MHNGLISVIVPIYNVEQYLSRCIDSIINQTYSNIELILVDDGSPDNCGQICDLYAKKDNRIKVVHKKNGGRSDARNAGLSVATGDLIMYIDSDDWIDSTMFEDMYNCMIEHDSDIVSTGVKWVEEDGTILRIDQVSDTFTFDNVEALGQLIDDNFIKQHVWNKLYKTDMINNILFEKGKYHEDIFWSYQVVGASKKVSVMKGAYYNYVQRAGSIMGESYSYKRLDALDAMKQRCEYMQKNYPQLFNKALKSYIGSCMYHLQLAIKSKQNHEVIGNIKERVCYHKNGNMVEEVTGKQKFWLKLFVKFPMFTCKVRNILRIGL